MTKTLVDNLKQRFSSLKSDRANFENHWQEVAEVFQPRNALFTATKTPGEKRNYKTYDSRPTLVPERFAAAMESLMTPRGAFWHGLTVASDPELDDYVPVRQWLEAVQKVLFRYRYRANSGFVGAIKEAYQSIGIYGTQTLYVEEGTVEDPLRYRSVFLAETYVDTSFVNLVDTMYRAHDMTARQCEQRWGRNQLAPGMVKELDNPSASMKRWPILSVALPFVELGRTSPVGFKTASVHIDLTNDHVMQMGGYYEMPYKTSRFSQAPNEMYGRGPGIFVLQQAKTLNAKARTVLRAGEKAVDPPLAAANTTDLYQLDANASAINYGALDQQGNELVKPMGLGANLLLGREEMQRDQDQIDEAFWVNLFQILIENPTMTATEVLERSKEKAELIGPAIGKQETELIGPMVEREMAVLFRKNLLPPPPQELQGQELEVFYTSPMAKMRRAGEGAGIARTFEYASAAAAYDPSAMDKIKLPDSVQQMAEINGMPADLLRSDDEVEALAEQRAQEQQMQAQMAAMESMSKSASDASNMVDAMGNVAQ